MGYPGFLTKVLDLISGMINKEANTTNFIEQIKKVINNQMIAARELNIK